MSLATTCTHCGTCFRVVQDQLRVSEGWVRCGHCQQVFNALESLFDLEAPNEPVALPSASPSSGRGTWQTEAAARWMRQHSQESAAPSEREEPLNDDMLAALRADSAPAPLDVDDTVETTAPETRAAAEHDAAADPDEEAPADGSNVTFAIPATGPDVPDDMAAAPAVEISEPAPLDDDAGTETTFAPLPISLDRHEPFFEAPSYEPRSLPVAAPLATLSGEGLQPSLPLGFSPDEEEAAVSASPSSDPGPASAAMFLSTADAVPAAAVEEAEAQPVATPSLPDPVEDATALAPLHAPMGDEEHATAVPSFLAEAEKRERRARPTRWAFAAVAVLLTLSLVGQVAWHWRERLAMAWPLTQRPLAALCEPMGCTLGAPRELTAVIVDNTALARPPGTSGYRLTVQLHNRATHPVATPHVDLTLTDAQGATVSRRVLVPADFGYDDAQLPAQADLQWTAEFTLSEGSLVGYTVAAFYP